MTASGPLWRGGQPSTTPSSPPSSCGSMQTKYTYYTGSHPMGGSTRTPYRRGCKERGECALADDRPIQGRGNVRLHENEDDFFSHFFLPYYPILYLVALGYCASKYYTAYCFIYLKQEKYHIASISRACGRREVRRTDAREWYKDNDIASY